MVSVKHPKCRLAKLVHRFSPRRGAQLAMRYHVRVLINGKLFWSGTIGEMLGTDAVPIPRG
jgi:hypothetical protein